VTGAVSGEVNRNQPAAERCRRCPWDRWCRGCCPQWTPRLRLFLRRRWTWRRWPQWCRPRWLCRRPRLRPGGWRPAPAATTSERRRRCTRASLTTRRTATTTCWCAGRKTSNALRTTRSERTRTESAAVGLAVVASLGGGQWRRQTKRLGLTPHRSLL